MHTIPYTDQQPSIKNAQKKNKHQMRKIVSMIFNDDFSFLFFMYALPLCEYEYSLFHHYDVVHIEHSSTKTYVVSYN